LRMKACYFETSVTNYKRARCSVQKDLPPVSNTELSDVLEAVNVKSSFLWCDAILIGRFLPYRWIELVSAKNIYICQSTEFLLHD